MKDFLRVSKTYMEKVSSPVLKRRAVLVGFMTDECTLPKSQFGKVRNALRAAGLKPDVSDGTLLNDVRTIRLAFRYFHGNDPDRAAVRRILDNKTELAVDGLRYLLGDNFDAWQKIVDAELHPIPDGKPAANQAQRPVGRPSRPAGKKTPHGKAKAGSDPGGTKSQPRAIILNIPTLRALCERIEAEIAGLQEDLSTLRQTETISARYNK